VFTTERQLKEHGDKVPPDVRATIESALNNLKDALKSDDGGRIKPAIENLHQATSKMGEAIYGAAGGQPGGGGPGAGPGPGSDRATAGAGAATGGDGKKKDEDVIDAEYEVKE